MTTENNFFTSFTTQAAIAIGTATLPPHADIANAIVTAPTNSAWKIELKNIFLNNFYGGGILGPVFWQAGIFFDISIKFSESSNYTIESDLLDAWVVFIQAGYTPPAALPGDNAVLQQPYVLQSPIPQTQPNTGNKIKVIHAVCPLYYV